MGRCPQEGSGKYGATNRIDRRPQGWGVMTLAVTAEGMLPVLGSEVFITAAELLPG